MDVQIGQSYNLCTLEPWLPALEQELSFSKANHRHGYIPDDEPRTTYERKQLYHVPVEAPTRGIFPTGLLPRVLDFLRARGHSATVHDHRDLNRVKPMPDFTKVAKLRPGQGDALVQIAYADCGIIVAATAFGKSFVIEQACKMYPSVRFLVTSPRVSVVNSLYRRLCSGLGEENVGIARGGKVVTDRRVVVTTTKSMKKVDPHEIDMLFFDEVHGVGDNEVANTLGYFNRCRMFGFTASPVRGDKSEMCMEALFGRFLIEVGYEEAVDLGNVVPIEVRMVTIGGEVRRFDDTIRNKRASYWQNDRRNDAVRRCAERFPDDEQCLVMVETLEHAIRLQMLMPSYTVVHFGKVKLDYHVYTWKPITPSGEFYGWIEDEKLVNGTTYAQADEDTPQDIQRYAWVSESVTDKVYKERCAATGQRIEYAGRFKTYDAIAEKRNGIVRIEHDGEYILVRQEEYICGKAKSELAMTDKEKDELTKQFERGELKKVIATGTWKEGVDFEQLSVLIRADGATSAVNSTQIPGRLSRLFPGKTHGILIDFRDTFNDWAARRTETRLTTYRSHGWTILN